jgi:hypothetical protein
MDINSSINITTETAQGNIDALNRRLTEVRDNVNSINKEAEKIDQLAKSAREVENQLSSVQKLAEIGGKIEAGFTAAKSAASAVASDPAITAAFDKFKSNQSEENKVDLQRAEEHTQALMEALRSRHAAQQQLVTEQAAENAATAKVLSDVELAAQQETADRSVEIEKASFEAKAGLALQSVDLLSSVNTLLSQKGKEQNDLQKTLALVKIGIDTAVAISSALRNTSGPTPDNVATGGLAGIAKFVAISAQIVAAAAKAKAILGAGQGGGGFNAPSVPGISAPQIQPPNVNGGTAINPPAKQQEPIKVYVTEADIRNAQNRVNVIEGQSVVL